MNTQCKIIKIEAEVQENGIIRNSKGYLIGRLVDKISFDSEHIFGYPDSPPKKHPCTLNEIREMMES